MKIRNIHSKITLIAFIPLTILTEGCGANLDNVKSLSIQGSNTSKLYPTVVEDFYDSCIRISEYQFGSTDTPIIPIEEAITGISGEKSEFIKTCNEQFRIITDNDEREEKIEKKTVNSITKAVILSEILAQYFDEIGKLAGVNVNFKQETTNLASAVKGIPNIATSAEDQAQLDAGFNILSFLLRIITNEIREKTLKNEITARNIDIEIVTIALEDTIKTYKTQLFTEEKQVQDFYGSAIKNLSEKQKIKQMTIPNLYSLSVLLKSNWIDERSILRDKLNIADDYIKLLQQLRIRHNKVSKTLASISIDGKYSKEEIANLNSLLAKISIYFESKNSKINSNIKKLKLKAKIYDKNRKTRKKIASFLSDDILTKSEIQELDLLISDYSFPVTLSFSQDN